MKNKKNIKIFYLILSICFIVYSIFSKPFIECNNKDSNIYKTIIIVLGIILFIPNIINFSKFKKRGIKNFIIVILGIISSVFIYQNHSKDYKIRNELYLKNLIKIDNSILTDSVEPVIKDINVDEKQNDVLRVNYLDVNQGDSIFIELPNKETMLIDAGERNYDKKVISYIDNLGYNKIDYVVGTHPHTDHIGGMASVIKKYDIGSIYMPKKQSNSNTFVNLLKTIKDKNLKINTAKSGVKIIDSDNLKVSLIAPTKEYNDSNNSSAVVKITYINRCFLFMGDAEVESESSITDNVECDVVKIGHHGSDTASSESFVKKTKAKYAIVSVGEGNKYKHPYDFILKRWESIGAKVFRTDKLGDIVITTDGNNLIVNDDSVSIDSNNNKDSKVNNNDNSNIEIINVDTTAGKIGEIKIKGKPNKEYSIKVYFSSGISKAKGLESKFSDEYGYVTWNFKISSNTKKGNYKFIINDEEFDYEIK